MMMTTAAVTMTKTTWRMRRRSSTFLPILGIRNIPFTLNVVDFVFIVYGKYDCLQLKILCYSSKKC
jgi:hypothetical protein